MTKLIEIEKVKKANELINLKDFNIIDALNQVGIINNADIVNYFIDFTNEELEEFINNVKKFKKF